MAITSREVEELNKALSKNLINFDFFVPYEKDLKTAESKNNLATRTEA